MEISIWEMLKKLWSVTPKDCRLALVGEFIFNPEALKDRYYNEIVFQHNLKSLWN